MLLGIEQARTLAGLHIKLIKLRIFRCAKRFIFRSEEDNLSLIPANLTDSQLSLRNQTAALAAFKIQTN